MISGFGCILRVKDNEEQDDCQDVLEVEGRVDGEVPDSEAALVPIGVDLVRVAHLVRDHLVQLASLELHLLFVKLVLNDI